MAYRVIERGSRDRLGEGPVWVEARREIVWVDILGQAVHRLHLGTQEIQSTKVDEAVGWVLPRHGQSTFIAGLRSGFAIFDIDSGDCRHFGAPESDRPDNRLNDAKVDRFGRIWAGSKDDTDREASGALYCINSDLTWARIDDGYKVTNGPTFSRDGGTMFHTDSAHRTVFAFDMHDDGTVSDKRPWLIFEDEWGYPDGMTTDADGCLWIAHWGAGRISRFSPEGAMMRSIRLPATNITSCTFAGDGLSRMFVTSSTIDHEDEPLAGAIFEIDPEVTGTPSPAFAG